MHSVENKVDKMDEALIAAAKAYRSHAYAPYSKFAVGAAVLAASGRIYGGANIENASYSLTNCAERTAIFKALSEGETHLTAIAVVADTKAPCAPCGACRQVIAEFGIDRIIMANLAGDRRNATFSELLPSAFSMDDSRLHVS